MRNTAGVAVGLLALARLAVAACDTTSPCQASADAVPGCAKSCILSAAVTRASCSTQDYQCQCSKQSVIQSAAANCVIGACGLGGALQVLPSVSALCTCVTAHPTVPCPALAIRTLAEPAITTAAPAATEPPAVTGNTGPITTAPPPSPCNSASPCQASADAVPECAKPCIESAAVTEAGCPKSDYQCECDKRDVIQDAAIMCVLDSCGLEGALEVLPAVGAMCDCVTAHPSTPCTSAPASPTSTSVSEPDTTEEPPETTPSASCSTSDAGSTSDAVSTSDSIPTSTSSAATGPITTGPSTCNTESSCQASADAVPDCAKPCIESAAVTEAGCARSDYQCECSKQDIIQEAAINCVLDSCGLGGALEVLPAVGSLCECVTARPTTPCTSVPATTTSEPPTTITSKASSSEPGTTSKPNTTSKAATTSDANTTCKPGSASDCGPVASTAVPSCAQACFSSAAPKIPCDVHDYGCQCQPDAQESLTKLLVPCVATACPPASIPAVIAGAASVCACATAPPSPGDCFTTGPGGSQTITSTSAATPTSNPEPPSSTTGKDGSGPSSSSSVCQATTQDCGPVASTAVPSCAQACFTSAAPKIPCDVHDYACQCQPDAQASLTQLLVPCVATACPPASVAAVIAGASSVCACATGPAGGGDCGGGGQPTSGHGGQPTGEPTGEPSGKPTGEPTGQPTGKPTEQPTGGNSEPSGGHGGQPTGGHEQPSGGNGGQPTGGSGGSEPGRTCEVVTVSSSGNVETSTTCYPTGGQPTGGGDGGDGDGGNNGGGDGGSEPTSPPVVIGSAARFEIGLVAGIFGVVWLMAIAL